MKRKKQILKIAHSKDRVEAIASMIPSNRKFYIMEDNSVKNIVVPAIENIDKDITYIAHHDVVSCSYGYNDNTSGVVTLLNIISKLPFVNFVFTDKEEKGGLGIDFYLKNKKPDIVINVGVVGIGDTIFYQNTYGINLEEYIQKRFKNIKKVENLMFHDGSIVKNYGIPTALIISYFKEQENRIVSGIFEYQHCNNKDNEIKYLNEKQIKKVENFLAELAINLKNKKYVKNNHTD